MNKRNFKITKVLGLSILSFVIYFILDNSDRMNSILIKVQGSNSSRGFGVYITLKLLKWFLLIFGIISLTVIIFEFFKKEKD